MIDLKISNFFIISVRRGNFIYLNILSTKSIIDNN